MIKKNILLAAVFLFSLCVLLSACGAEEENEEESVWRGIEPGQADLSYITERTEYYDVSLKSEDFNSVTEGKTVGVQFFQGERIQLYTKGNELYMQREDGSSELLLQNVPDQYVFQGVPLEEWDSGQYSLYYYRWYVDQEGNCYTYGTVTNQNGQYSEEINSVIRFLPSGEILYETFLETDVKVDSMCQTEDGHMYLLLNDQRDMGDFGNGSWMLEEIEHDTGKRIKDSVVELPYTYRVFMGKTGVSPIVTGGIMGSDDCDISIVDVKKESLSPILFLCGVSYGWHIDLTFQDMRVTEDGGIELLWLKQHGETGGVWERLKMGKVDKTPIVLRGLFDNNSWLEGRVSDFNMENENYHVILEDCGSSNDQEDFARLTSVQIGAGKGPDIINGYLMEDYIDGMLEKGALEELTPYMEASGIREEDYFPAAFATWRQGEKIYGIHPLMLIWDERIDEAVLGSSETPDMETLLDALLAWEGGGVYLTGYDSAQVLKTFLLGTDSLWGMVDWENGSCEFNTPLFGRMLEAARRYGDDGRKDSQLCIAERGSYDTVRYLDGAAEREAKGKIISGVLFEDGCHAVSEAGYALAINANSANKDGAWEFISFLMSEKAQSDFELRYLPTHRAAYELWLKCEVKWANGARIPGVVYDTSEEKQEELRQRIEDAQPVPYRTAPIFDIILEEAGDYFSGSKSAEEVSGVINRRVLLYLNERK